ncbi:MAG: diguanylate cyclase [Deltaproteobacteria bacterium]|nr:diguanylate cyclase [Deltaproteobacteria bacterium]
MPLGWKRTASGAALASLLVGGVLVLWVLLAQRARDDERWVSHSLQVRLSASELILHLKDAESNYRGYLLIGTPDLAQRYFETEVDTRKAMAGLQELMGRGEPVDPARLKKLDEGVTAELALMHAAVMQKQQNEFEALMKELQAGTARQKMALVREVMGELDGAQQALMAQREERARRSVERVTVLTLLGLFLAAGAAIFSATVAWQNRQAREQVTEELRQKTELLSSVLDGMGDGCMVMDAQRKLILMNPAARRIFGEALGSELPADWPTQLRAYKPDKTTLYAPEEGPLTRATQGHPADGAVMFLRTPHKPEGVWISVTARPLRDKKGAVIAGVSVLRDVTAEKRAEEQLTAQADRLRAIAQVDELTGLCNRRGFLTLASQRLELARRQKTPVAVLFADLDGLKQINDTLGHEAGDAALKDIAQVLKKSLREGDVLARLGGDEFAALVTQATAEELPFIERRLVQTAENLDGKDGRKYKLRASVGFAAWDPRVELERPDIEAMIAMADERMYAQKKGKKAAG